MSQSRSYKAQTFACPHCIPSSQFSSERDREQHVRRFHSRASLSAAWMFVEDDRSKVCDSLKALKQRICQYGAVFGQRCDCKYGPYGVGEASGCAELTMVIAGIEQMTDLQWQRFLKGWGAKLAGNGKVLSAPKGK